MSPLRQQSKYSESLTADLKRSRFTPVRGAAFGLAAGAAVAFILAASWPEAVWVLIPCVLGAAGWRFASAREKLHYQKEIIAHLQSQLLQRAVIDETTDLYNHDFFLKEAAREMERSKRYGRMLSVLLVDVKDFRRLNEEYGNISADLALRAVAEALTKSVRRVDTLGRYGGDEFLIMLPGAKPKDAEKVGDRIKRSVSSLRFAHEGKSVPLAVEIRVIECGTIAELDVFELVSKADRVIAEMRGTPAAPAAPQ